MSGDTADANRFEQRFTAAAAIGSVAEYLVGDAVST